MKNDYDALGYAPVYTPDGRRAKNREYIDRKGNIISRRKYLEKQGVIPEIKAAERYEKGISTKRPISLKRAETLRANVGKTKWMLPKGVSYRDRGKGERYWQLAIEIERKCESKKVIHKAYGFSKLYKQKDTAMAMNQAIDHALAQNAKKSGDCELVRIISYAWLRWVR